MKEIDIKIDSRVVRIVNSEPVVTRFRASMLKNITGRELKVAYYNQAWAFIDAAKWAKSFHDTKELFAKAAYAMRQASCVASWIETFGDKEWVE